MPRPKKLIKLSEIKKVARLYPTDEEAAGYFEISVRSWKRLLAEDPRAARAWEHGKLQGKLGLRRKQHVLAGVNAAMAIHLGKNLLDQKDKTSTELSGPGGGPIETKDSIDYSRLSAQELEQLLALRDKAKRTD